LQLADLPGQIRDVVTGEVDSKFTVIDGEGNYTCAWCGETS
jgi:hypothetical protein